MGKEWVKLGISQNILSTETRNPISNEKTHEFLNDLIDYLILVKSYGCTSINDVTSTCEQLFKQYTKPFYEKWSFLLNLSWHPGYAKLYSSFVLSYSEGNVLLPYKFLTYEALNPGNTIVDQLQCSKNIDLFFFNLNKLFHDSNLQLNENDLKIIKFFLNPFLQDKISSIPTNRQIAQSTGCSENTISRRISQLYKKSILSHFYIVNMAKMGFYTSIIIHTDRNKETPFTFERYCLADIPIDWGESLAKLKIFVIHSTNKKICKEIKTFFDPLYEVTLTKSSIGWNLNSLTPKTEDRWKLLPSVFQGGRWENHHISGQFSLEHNLLPTGDGLKLNETRLKMLDIIQKGSLSNYHLSKMLKVGQKYIKHFYEDFFANQLVQRFTMLMNIGLSSKVCIILLGPKSNRKISLLENIVEHLKSFPFSYIFYNNRNLDSNGRLILAGSISMPSSWLADFHSVWMRLIDHGFFPKLNISQGIIKRGINLSNTYLI